MELALVLPVLLLIVMFALDFGRAFYSWVTITNATRVGANYAASHPGDTYPNDDYTSAVQAEALNAICPVVAGTYNPSFIDGPDAGTFNRDLGDSAQVSVSCTFKILTPVIGSIVGNGLVMSASSTFPIRTETE
ncbi:MAG: TadE/TadG family type IV pilus assembly protein [Chloroflexota bacterium]